MCKKTRLVVQICHLYSSLTANDSLLCIRKEKYPAVYFDWC